MNTKVEPSGASNSDFGKIENKGMAALVLSLVLLPSAVDKVKHWGNVVDPVDAGQIVQVCTSPTSNVRDDGGFPRAPMVRIDKQEVWSFTDQQGRIVHVQKRAVPQLAEGDFVRIDAMHSGLRAAEAEKATKL